MTCKWNNLLHAGLTELDERFEEVSICVVACTYLIMHIEFTSSHICTWFEQKWIQSGLDPEFTFHAY